LTVVRETRGVCLNSKVPSVHENTRVSSFIWGVAGSKPLVTKTTKSVIRKSSERGCRIQWPHGRAGIGIGIVLQRVESTCWLIDGWVVNQDTEVKRSWETISIAINIESSFVGQCFEEL